ncbi:hypothetical protein M408DRAFT_80020, partial [Serendipita vermifera MAFF 305830]
MTLLPPSPDEVRDSLCVLFIGSTTTPLAENIKTLSPCLVRKSRVSKLITFLTSNNPHYAPSDTFSGLDEANLNALNTEAIDLDNDFTPAAIEIAQLDPSKAQGELDVTADYTNRNDAENDEGIAESADLLIENVGYTDGDTSPQNFTLMKLKAMRHCLDGNAFLQSRSGNLALNDFDNPHLLSWLFPHLDPWGIGGFHEKRRSRPLSMEQQLKCLISRNDPSFARDPTFAFVYHNICLKKRAIRESLWRVNRKQHVHVTEQILATPPDLIKQLEAKFERNPKYQPTNDAEKSVVQLLSQMQSMNNRLTGTNGYKKTTRNEGRSLIHRHGAPALF